MSSETVSPQDTGKRKPRSLIGLIRDIRADNRGVSAVEFAFILPIMLTLYFGGVELSQVIAADRKTTLVARTISDLVAQGTIINNAEMGNIMSASVAVATPYPVNNLRIVVSSIDIDNNRRATVTWSDTCRGTRRAIGSVITLPNGLDQPNSSIVLAEVSYAHTPTVGYVLTNTINVSDRIYMRPRLVQRVERQGNAATCPS
jgi:Flp pilus assembly protein TadG